MPGYRPLMLLSLALACVEPTPDEAPDADPADTAAADTGGEDTGGDDTGGDGEGGWQFLVYLVGDNDLEDWVTHDLNELEITGSGDGVEVLVQADRIDGYSKKDGDWTGTRRYRMVGDADTKVVTSPVLEDLGELDMGAPETLAGFLDWASINYPAEHRVLIFWDHGDGWGIQAQDADADTEAAAPPPMIGSDDTSGTEMSFAEGEVAAALAASVAAHGRFDVVGFDACNMASWEVAHSLVPHARAMSAAQTTVGFEGFQYELILRYLRDNPETTPMALADEMSRGAVEVGLENTHSATDLDQLGELDDALDALAGAVLADDALKAPFFAYRRTTRGADAVWKNWYLDVGDLGAVIEAAGDPVLAPLGTTLRNSVVTAVPEPYGSEDYTYASGLTVWFDPDSEYIDMYTEGAGATWSQDTRWGELMRSYLRE